MDNDAEYSQTLLNLFLNLTKETAVKAHNYIGSHSSIVGYLKYPVRRDIFPKDNPEYSKLRESTPYIFYDIPRYELKDFPKSRIQYDAIFSIWKNDHIKVEALNGYSELLDHINQNPDFIKLLIEGNDPKLLKFKLNYIIEGIVGRYLYCTNATKDIPTDLDEKLLSFIVEKLSRYTCARLGIDIYIPICLVTFEDDNIRLSDQAEIIRIPGNIQQARQQACAYETSSEDWVASCATHMIVLHNFGFNNERYSNIPNDYRNYPLQSIDEIMAIIRIVTGYALGYEQILCFPLNWVDSFCADLTPIYGAKSHFVNAKELKKSWMELPVAKINKCKISEIQNLYSTFLSLKEDKSNGNLVFALKRFNRCMLRDEDDDMTLDATIGLEALLSGETKNEITYTISNRIPIVFANEQNDFYTAENCRSIMKKIYNLRSKIVHGANIKNKDMFHEINESMIKVETIAVDFFRYSLLFFLHHPEYIDAKKIDEYIDCTISEKKL